jgi:hypothetical protein
MNATNDQTLRFDEKFTQTYPIATLSLDISQIVAKNPTLIFQDSWDDLDYLKYCMVEVVSGSKVALVSHNGSPVPGIDICINPKEDNLSRLLVSALCHIGMTTQDLTWMHPDYLLKLQQEWSFQTLQQAC